MEDLVRRLKKLVDEYGMVDVGSGAAEMFGVKQTTLDSALSLLKKDGYLTYGGRLPSVTADGKTKTIKVLCRPGVNQKDIFTDKVYHLA